MQRASRNGEIPNIPESPNGWGQKTWPKCKCGIAAWPSSFIFVSKMIFLFAEVKKRLGWTCQRPKKGRAWLTMAAFWIFLSKKHLRQISILCNNNYKIRKSKGFFKVDITKVFFLILVQLDIHKTELQL